MSRQRFYHPLWTHIPGVLVLTVLVYAVIQALPLPARAPVHVSFSGQPDRYGSPWEIICFTVILSILCIGFSIFIDELWARYERRKTFNWMSLFDEITVGISAGVTLSYLRMLVTHDYSRPFYLKYMLLSTIPALAVAAALELSRHYHPQEASIITQDTNMIQAEVIAGMRSGRPMMYWESQQMPYATIPLVILGLAFLAAAMLSLGEPGMPYVFLFNACVFLAIAFIFHGISITVTPERLMVKLQAIGSSLLKIDVEEIAEVEPYSFSPLGDFGGWGIRSDGKIKAYYWRGSRGVLITTNGGKKFLVGSDNPDRLAAVMLAIKSNEGITTQRCS